MFDRWSVKAFLITVLVVFLASFGLAGLAGAEDETICRMQFSLEGWSALYQTAEGSGTITCENGQSADVTLAVKGGGITAGTIDIEDGIGRFSAVPDISELFGPYVKAEAHAGAGESASAQVMTKGDVSLALSGTGEGVNLGISFGRLTIEQKE